MKNNHCQMDNQGKMTVLRFLFLFCFFALTWLFLSGILNNLFLLVLGILSIVFVLFISLRMNILDFEIFQYRWLYPAFKYWSSYLMREIIISNLQVAKKIIKGNTSISPCIATIPFTLKTNFGRSFYANSTTLTPGTVTIKIKDNYMIIHALSYDLVPSSENNTMLNKVKQLEQAGIYYR